jgi:hypothetical protein
MGTPSEDTQIMIGSSETDAPASPLMARLAAESKAYMAKLE